MKKLLLILMALVLTVTVVYAEPADAEAAEPVEISEEAGEAVAEEPAEDAPMPVEEETGVQVKMILDVNLDASSKFVSRQYMDDEMYGIYEQMKDQLSGQAEQMGLTVAFGDEGGKKHMDLVGESAAGDPIVFSPNGPTDSSYRFASKKGFFGTQYFVTANFDSRAALTETPVEEAQVIAQLTMNLPVGASFNDANLAENGNKTLVWNIAQGRMNSITVMFTIPNIINIAVLIGLLIVLILVIVFIVLGKKKTPLTDAELVQDALNHIEGETDDFVDDPFATMTEEEINMDVEDEPVEETVEEIVEEVAEEVTEEVTEETEE